MSPFHFLTLKEKRIFAHWNKSAGTTVEPFRQDSLTHSDHFLVLENSTEERDYLIDLQSMTPLASVNFSSKPIGYDNRKFFTGSDFFAFISGKGKRVFEVFHRSQPEFSFFQREGVFEGKLTKNLCAVLAYKSKDDRDQFSVFISRLVNRGETYESVEIGEFPIFNSLELNKGIKLSDELFAVYFEDKHLYQIHNIHNDRTVEVPFELGHKLILKSQLALWMIDDFNFMIFNQESEKLMQVDSGQKIRFGGIAKSHFYYFDERGFLILMDNGGNVVFHSIEPVHIENDKPIAAIRPS